MSDPTEKLYLDYLDKEMSIMGILSTFCIAVIALVLDRVVSADKGYLVDVWEYGHRFIVVGSGLMLFASFFFYRQRSLLASHYGDISFCIAQSSKRVETCLEKTRSWTTWFYYRIAFGCLFVAFVEYGLALFSLKEPHLQKGPLLYALLPVGAYVIVQAPWLWILSKLPNDEDSPAKHSSTILRKSEKETAMRRPLTEGGDEDRRIAK
jgi:hypothetical protein